MTDSDQPRYKLSISMDQTLHDRVRAQAKTEDMPVAIWVRRALRHYLEAIDAPTR